jgi:hypothetical protein
MPSRYRATACAILARLGSLPHISECHPTTASKGSQSRARCSREPTPVYLKRLEALEAFLEELDELFASKRAAAAWLDKSLAVLKDRTPRAMILDGHVDRVTGVLYALNAGVSL